MPSELVMVLIVFCLLSSRNSKYRNACDDFESFVVVFSCDRSRELSHINLCVF